MDALRVQKAADDVRGLQGARRAAVLGDGAAEVVLGVAGVAGAAVNVGQDGRLRLRCGRDHPVSMDPQTVTD